MDLEKRLYEALKSHKPGRKSPKPDLFRKPPVGILRETDAGPVWMVETVYDEGYLHGKIELSTEIPRSVVEFMDSALDPGTVNLKEIAVIDTETTGLAGGTGTYPFILGVGFLEGSRFVVRQYILRDFCEEPAQLLAFSDDLADKSTLLTYNGKSFDIPLLRTRFRINRMSIPFSGFSHIDLVHPCRRLFKRHFDSFQLSRLEAMIVGYERLDDVPSHLIPYIYFDFLQSRDDSLLLPILNHNRDDIVSLYLLAQTIGRRIELALDGCCEDDLLLLSMARIMFDKREYEKSRFFVDLMKPGFVSTPVVDESLMLKSRLAKRIRNWEEASRIWRDMIDSGRFGIYPYIEIAKHLEHREKDHGTALTLTDAALKLIEFEQVLSSETAAENLRSALMRRKRRLQKKIAYKK